jgi:TPR repeat protein
MTNLGIFYETGRGGLPKDEREAARLYKLAADEGEPMAQYHLAKYYATGRGGLPKNKQEATRLFRLAASHGVAASQQLKVLPQRFYH